MQVPTRAQLDFPGMSPCCSLDYCTKGRPSQFHGVQESHKWVHFAAVLCLSLWNPGQMCPAEWRGNLPPTPAKSNGTIPSWCGTCRVNPVTTPDLLPVTAPPGCLKGWQSRQCQEILLFCTLIAQNFNTVEMIYIQAAEMQNK